MLCPCASGGSNETARIHHACRWDSGNLAGGDVRATDGQASNCWSSGSKCFELCSLGCCFCGSHARTRLGRRPFEYRWSEGRPERYAEIAAEFVRLNVDVILTVGSAVPIVRQATTVIPIVFAVAIDPVGSGLVASLAKPGGNATGLSIQEIGRASCRERVLRLV